MPTLFAWQTFYEIMGSASGALTGLQFVAMALIADVPIPADEQGAGTFSSPTIVHFVAVLALAASAAIPWNSLGPLGIAWTLAGIAGVIYIALTSGRMRRQTIYVPVAEDWFFHILLPLFAYAALAACGLCLRTHARGGLFGMAGVSLLLLVTGIHNSWDNCTYLVFMKRRYSQNASSDASTAQASVQDDRPPLPF